MMYVIHKNSRAPGNVSYAGPTWDRAGLRDQYQETYSDREYAEFLALKLYDHNPGVGFKVSLKEEEEV